MLIALCETILWSIHPACLVFRGLTKAFGEIMKPEGYYLKHLTLTYHNIPMHDAKQTNINPYDFPMIFFMVLVINLNPR